MGCGWPCIVNLMRALARFLFLAVGLQTIQSAAPPGFPKSGNGLWYTTPGVLWTREYLPISNGFLAAMIPGGTTTEMSQLNIESLWSGGPVHDPTYNGGNKQPSERAAMAQFMQSARGEIWSNGTIADVNVLTTDAGAYGSYTGAGYLISTVTDKNSSSNYARWLDLDIGIAATTWTTSKTSYTRESFCSYPLKACVEHLTASSALPAVTYAFSTSPEDGLPTPNITCLDSTTLRVRGLADSPGLTWEILGRVKATSGRVLCSAIQNSGPANATITVSEGASESWITWTGATDYDQDKGTPEAGFSFQGEDPHNKVVTTSAAASSLKYSAIRSQHVLDHQSHLNGNGFSLNLGQTSDLSRPTNELRSAYKLDEGSPYLEWLVFNYGRYMLATSARGDLPANLQGKWALGYSNPWSGDYHANINTQMNYWSAEMTGLDVTQSLFDYIEKTWAPRGKQTAEILYNITRGWVTHNEMNIFGHTGMKAFGVSAEWANYPESAVWMMVHVWDHFDYTNDIDWFKRQGWPLIKGVTSFHLDKLIPDLRSNDGTLVVSPCNSPEQAPITLGCAHAQQLIWQLFNSIEKGFAASGDTDVAFLKEVQDKRAKMDKGIRIGSWGQLQEWKIDMDSQTDTHRHLSHLIGLYPGYAISSYDSAIQTNGKAYTKDQIIQAAQTSLIARGDGIGSDADSGWEKAWRAAAWAQLGNAEKFYHELTFTISENFAENLFSMYSPSPDPIFQIDANLGFPGAVLNALIQAPDVASLSTPLIITLLPALPAAWPSGSIKGVRIRGGIQIDLDWQGGKATKAVVSVARTARSNREIRVVYAGRTVSSFTTSPGTTNVLSL